VSSHDVQLPHNVIVPIVSQSPTLYISLISVLLGWILSVSESTHAAPSHDVQVPHTVIVPPASQLPISYMSLICVLSGWGIFCAAASVTEKKQYLQQHYVVLDCSFIVFFL
jgi:hypothetical protein